MCVCLCVCAWPQKSAITFERGDGSAQNFQGRPYSRRVIFGRVTRTPARKRKNAFYGKSISSWGFDPAGTCHTISETRGQGGKNVGSGILSFCPYPEKTGPEIRAVRGGSKNLGILTFFIKGTPTKSGPGSIPELCVRALKRTPGPPRARPVGRGVKISKSK